jgi:dihydroxy-acid dehydratase
MPEVGNMPLPRKILEKGVKDMVRISDARMSGTAFGTVILHVSPESDAGGPLAVVRSGDIITLDGPTRALNIAISDEEMAERLKAWRADRPAPTYTRGYAKLYVDHVLQADKGCDLDFLVGASGSVVTRESH